MTDPRRSAAPGASLPRRLAVCAAGFPWTGDDERIRTAPGDGDDGVGRHRAHRGPRLGGRAPDVRGEDRVRRLEKAATHVRLVVEDVEARAPDPAIDQGGREGRLVEDRP